MIKRVSINNLEAFDGEQVIELGQRTILFGPNGIGKSSVLRAIELAMTGKVGAVGGTAAKRAGLLRSGKAAGSATIVAQLPGAGDEHSFAQVLARKGATVKEYPLLDGEEGVSASETAALRDQLLDSSPISFDLGAFLGLSDAKRRDWIVANIAAAREEAELLDEIVLEALEELLGQDAVRTALAMASSREGALVGLWSAHNPATTTLRGVHEALAELLRGGIQDLVEKLHRQYLDARARRLQAEQALHGAADTAEPVSAEQIAELARQEKQMAERLAELAKLIGEGEEARRQVAAREGKIAGFDVELGILATKLDDAGDEPKATEDAARLQGVMEGLVEQRAQVVLEIKTRAELQAKLAAASPEAPAVCPTCNRSFSSSVAELKASLEHELDGLSARKAEIEASLSKSGLLFAGLMKRLEGWKRAREEKERVLRERQEWVTFNPDVPPVTALKAEQEELQTRFTELRAQRDAMARAKGAAELRAELSTNIERFRKEEAWLKALDAGARTVMHAPVSEACGQLNFAVRVLLGESGYTPFVSGGADQDVDFGLVFGGAKIPFERLSSGQQGVLGAAIAASFFDLMKRPPALRVVLIEAGEVDEGNLKAMMESMRSWSGVHNIVVATHLYPPAVDGWVYTPLGVPA